MASVKINTNRIRKQVKQILETAPFDRIGRIVVASIKESVRRGISPATGRPIPPLAESTIDRKRKLSRINSTSKFYQEGKSNLTFTGQLLNNLTHASFQSPDLLKIRIFTNPTDRRPLNGLRGGKLETTDNLRVQQSVEKGDSTKSQPPRPYLGLDERTRREVNQILQNHISAEINKINTGR